jgi:hypothetical protein
MHFLLFLFLLFAQQGKIEEYYIVHSKGDIKLKKTGQVLKKGDKIKAEEEVEFLNSDAKAIVISTQRGTLILQRPKNTPKKDGELAYIVKSSLISGSGLMGARDGPVNSMPALKSYLTKSSLLVLDTAKIPVSTQTIALSEEAYFFVRYVYKNQTINKKLAHKAPNLLIDRNILFVDGQGVPSDSCRNFTMYYRNEAKNESVPVTRFSPVFADMDKINSEAKLIADVMRRAGKNKEMITNEIKTFIHEVYGKPSEDDFSTWIARLL